jgi:hypothetical protein
LVTLCNRLLHDKRSRSGKSFGICATDSIQTSISQSSPNGLPISVGKMPLPMIQVLDTPQICINIYTTEAEVTWNSRLLHHCSC